MDPLGRGLQICAPSGADVCPKEPPWKGVKVGREAGERWEVELLLLASRGPAKLQEANWAAIISERDQVCSAGSSDVLHSGAATGFHGPIPRDVGHQDI